MPDGYNSQVVKVSAASSGEPSPVFLMTERRGLFRGSNLDQRVWPSWLWSNANTNPADSRR